MQQVDGCKPTYDNLTGQWLDPGLVEEAKRVEMDYFRSRQVCTRAPISDAKRTGGTIINMGWVVTNKGDAKKPDIRARLVGKEYRTEANDALYAAIVERTTR